MCRLPLFFCFLKNISSFHLMAFNENRIENQMATKVINLYYISIKHQNCHHNYKFPCFLSIHVKFVSYDESLIYFSFHSFYSFYYYSLFISFYFSTTATSFFYSTTILLLLISSYYFYFASLSFLYSALCNLSNLYYFVYLV